MRLLCGCSKWASRGRECRSRDCAKNLKARTYRLLLRAQTNVLDFLENMRKFFGDRSDIDAGLVADYGNYRKSQPSKMNPTRKIKGATVNRKLAYLRCIVNFAVKRKYISENPAHGVKLFDERRERPVKRMLAWEDEQRVLESARPYLRVAIVLLAQTGGRTYTEGFSLRWDQIDFDHKVLFFGGATKTEGSSDLCPERACT